MIYKIFIFLNSLLFVTPVYGQALRDRFDAITKESTSTGEGAFADLVQQIYNFAFPLAILCMFILLTYGAYKMITSAGDPEKLNEAKEIITNAILGVLMIGLGIGILRLIAAIIEVPTT